MNDNETRITEGDIYSVRSKKRSLLIAIPLIVLAVGMFAWAAYLGVGLVMRRVNGDGGMIAIPSADGKSKSYGRKLDMEFAPDVPKRSPDVTGSLGEVEENQLFLKALGDDTTPAQEVVVTKETKILRDTTFDERSILDIPEGEVVQQTVEEVEQDALQNGSLLTVWGNKRGDRLVAEVILYQQPKVRQNSDGSTTMESWSIGP